jgi:hypothetical protein
MRRRATGRKVFVPVAGESPRGEKGSWQRGSVISVDGTGRHLSYGGAVPTPPPSSSCHLTGRTGGWQILQVAEDPRAAAWLGCLPRPGQSATHLAGNQSQPGQTPGPPWVCVELGNEPRDISETRLGGCMRCGNKTKPDTRFAVDMARSSSCTNPWRSGKSSEVT